jgi:hypothetical protein
MIINEILAIGLFCKVTGDEIDLGVETFYFLLCRFYIFSFLIEVRDRDA